MPHFGEESVLVGRGGSGTIFFAGCNLHCVFCQNYDISQDDSGRPCTPAQIANLALELAQGGCENINFVTPSHVAHAVAEAIHIARSRGLTVPTVYNCGGYESLETLRFLEGLIDIYMPDFKYARESAGRTYSDVTDYPDIATAALAEMFRQTGPLKTNDQGIAEKGVMVRHLVMPRDLAGSQAVIDLVAETAPGCGLNVMAQYRPAYHAHEFPELMEYPSRRSVQSLRAYAVDKGLQIL
jgi:putative pyruvate formate lyase activating enzyme